MKKHRRRVERFSVSGEVNTYRYPFRQGGAFRVRYHAIDEVKKYRIDEEGRKVLDLRCRTLEAKNLTDAKAEVIDLAKAEKRDETRPETLGAALTAWLRTLDVRAETMVSYKAGANLYGRLLGPGRTVRDITFDDVQGLFSEAWKARSGRTKIYHRGMLTRFFDWCIDAGLARENPARRIKIQKAWSREVRKAVRESGQALTVDEARRLLAACRDSYSVDKTPKGKRETRAAVKLAPVAPPGYLFPFVFISLRTGLRCSNVIGSERKPPLTWGMADLDKGILEIPAGYLKNDMALRVPINSELLDWLRQRAAALGRPPRKDEPVIAGLEPGALLRKSFDSALKRAGLAGRGFRIHDLRHSFVAWLAASCPHSVMQVLAGHAPSSVTDRYAQHVREDFDALRRGIDSLPPLLGPAAVPAATVEAGK